MANKKNKKAKKPAVGKPAAGSNNKRAKKASPMGGRLQLKNEKTKQVSAKKQNEPVSEKVKKPSYGFSKLNQKFKAFLIHCKEKYSVKKALLLMAIMVAVVAGIIILIACFADNNYQVPDYVKTADYKGRVESEAVAFDMDISENQQEALTKATKSKGDKRKFDFFVNDTIVMNEYDDPALIEFGSADSNDCVLVFYIIDENGQELYRSLGIEPGRQIRSISFFDEIPYGTQDVTIAVLGYDAKTFKKVGMQTAQIKLEIGVD